MTVFNLQEEQKEGQLDRGEEERPAAEGMYEYVQDSSERKLRVGETAKTLKKGATERQKYVECSDCTSLLSA